MPITASGRSVAEWNLSDGPKTMSVDFADLAIVRDAISKTENSIAEIKSRPQTLKEAIWDLRVWVTLNASRVDVSSFSVPKIGAPTIANNGMLTAAAFVGPDVIFQHLRRELERWYATNVLPSSTIDGESRRDELARLKGELLDLREEERQIAEALLGMMPHLLDDARPAAAA